MTTPNTTYTPHTAAASRGIRAPATESADPHDATASALPADVPQRFETATALPADDALRIALHDEVHARPPPRVRLPALVVCVAVLNEGVDRDTELTHLRRLPGQQQLALDDPGSSFLSLRLAGHGLKWERHSEFSRVTIVQPLPSDWADRQGDAAAPLPHGLAVDAGWLRAWPGRTVAAIELVMIEGALDEPRQVLAAAQRAFGERTVVASLLGKGHSCAVTDFHVGANGFERMLVVAPAATSPTRAGRISQRLLELEVYRLMALRGLPVAKTLAPTLREAETALADITARLEDAGQSDQQLLDTLTSLAARIERTTAEHGYRFSATQAYATLVGQRIAELREAPIPGTQTLGEFMQRRLSPAIATVAATAQRLASLSERIARAGALLRTRVDIATEAQNQLLLAKLTRGQELQLRLQSTVEGLSIAAISYYVVSLLLYAGKAGKAAGMPIEPELAAGAAIPVVLWAVWAMTRRIHKRLHTPPG